MDKKNLLNRLIEVFKSNEEIETSFVDIKTIDGKILRVEDMVVEKAIKEITADGEIELEDGDYELEDGTLIKVEGGLIKELSVKEEEEVEEPVIEEEMSEEVVEEVVEDTTEVDGLIDNIKSLINEVADLKTEFKSLSKENEDLKLEVEKFSKAPSAEPTKVKVDFKKEESKNESIMYSILTNKNKK